MRPFLRFALRDLALAALTVGLVLADAHTRAEGTGTSALGVALGLATGALVVLLGFLAHEWGHLAGSLASGAVVHAPARLASVFLFRFDTGRSSAAQFLAMSAGGYAASVVAMGAILAWADLRAASGLSAVVLAGVGIAVTFALELPTTLRVWRGGALPGHGGVYVKASP